MSKEMLSAPELPDFNDAPEIVMPDIFEMDVTPLSRFNGEGAMMPTDLGGIGVQSEFTAPLYADEDETEDEIYKSAKSSCYDNTCDKGTCFIARNTCGSKC